MGVGGRNNAEDREEGSGTCWELKKVTIFEHLGKNRIVTNFEKKRKEEKIACLILAGGRGGGGSISMGEWWI